MRDPMDPRALGLVEQAAAERELSRTRRLQQASRTNWLGSSGGQAKVASPVGPVAEMAGQATVKTDSAGGSAQAHSIVLSGSGGSWTAEDVPTRNRLGWPDVVLPATDLTVGLSGIFGATVRGLTGNLTVTHKRAAATLASKVYTPSSGAVSVMPSWQVLRGDTVSLVGTGTLEAELLVLGNPAEESAADAEYLWLQDSYAPSAPPGDTDTNAIAFVYDDTGTQIRSLHLQPDDGQTLDVITGAAFDGSGRLWVADQTGLDPTYIPALLRIDPANGTILQRLQLPSTDPRFYAVGIAWSGTHMLIDDGSSATVKRITWIDLSDGSEFRSTTTTLPGSLAGKTPASWDDGVAFVAESTYVALSNTDGSATLVGLDDDTGVVTESTLVVDDYHPQGMVYDPDLHAIVMYRPGIGAAGRKIVAVNLATGATMFVWDAPAGFAGYGIALFP